MATGMEGVTATWIAPSNDIACPGVAGAPYPGRNRGGGAGGNAGLAAAVRSPKSNGSRDTNDIAMAKGINKFWRRRYINSYSKVYSVYIQGPPTIKFGDGTDLKAGTMKERP